MSLFCNVLTISATRAIVVIMDAACNPPVDSVRQQHPKRRPPNSGQERYKSIRERPRARNRGPRESKSTPRAVLELPKSVQLIHKGV